MQVYLGKNDECSPRSQSRYKSCFRLNKTDQKILTKCHKRQLFYQPSTSTKLLEKKLTIVEILRKNKLELPLQFTMAKGREVKSTLFGFQNDAMIASYCPKKNCVVPMLSTMHSQPDVAATSDKKPEVILFYNCTKGGVETLDKMVRTYTCKRMTRRWPFALFYNRTDVSAVNAFIVWLELTFMVKLIPDKNNNKQMII